MKTKWKRGLVPESEAVIYERKAGKNIRWRKSVMLKRKGKNRMAVGN